MKLVLNVTRGSPVMAKDFHGCKVNEKGIPLIHTH
jgi:hypothetical protein